MPKAEKVQRVTELKERIQRSQALFLADFRGLSVLDGGELRQSLKDVGAKFTVVKNTLMKLAVDEAGVGELQGLLEGPTAVAFVDGDAVAAAKSLVDATKRFRTLVVKGALVEGRLLNAEETQSLATTPPREVLLARIAGLGRGEMVRALSTLQALQRRFLGVANALAGKLPGEPPGEQEDQGEEEGKE